MRSSFFESVKQCVTLPDRTVLLDAFVVEDFMQKFLDLDPRCIFQDLLDDFECHDPKAEIPFSPKGDSVKWVTGEHPALHYRGNPLKRRKIWCQKNYRHGLLKYQYTGWQHSISTATCDVEYVSPIKKVSHALDKFTSQRGDLVEFNHYIATVYEDENHNIGFHSDADADFKENSYFVILKLGNPRKFEFQLAEPNSKVFYSKSLEPGTAVFVRAKSNDGTDANSRLRHGVPRMTSKCGISGSIVARCIKTVVPWPVVQQNIVKAKKTKAQRSKRKIERQEQEENEKKKRRN